MLILFVALPRASTSGGLGVRAPERKGAVYVPGAKKTHTIESVVPSSTDISAAASMSAESSPTEALRKDIKSKPPPSAKKKPVPATGMDINKENSSLTISRK